ncbi:ABC transporter G family member 14 [Cryptococcus sp. DSM 104548]
MSAKEIGECRRRHITIWVRGRNNGLCNVLKRKWEPCTLLLQSLPAGSMFYRMPVSTGGLFLRGGTLFLSLFFPSSISFSETAAAFTGRAVLFKHEGFSMYHPSALLLARTLSDLPIYFVMLTMITIIMYLMSGLKVEPGYYFTYLLFVYCTTLCTPRYFDSSATLLTLSTTPQKPLGSCFFYCQCTPAIVANEIDGLTLRCTAPNLAPNGGDYASHSQGCAIKGAELNDVSLFGTAWLNSALNFGKVHVWRNFGTLIAFWVFFLVLCAHAIEKIPAAASTKSVLLYKPGGGGKYIRQAQQKGRASRDEEDGLEGGIQLHEMNGVGQRHWFLQMFKQQNRELIGLTYTVNSNGQQRRLLDNVFSHCKAGTLTALMGSSGAGKTTLMDVLAARKREGDIQGEVLLNGKHLPVSFQRAKGYCEQMNPRHLSDKEKFAYVNTIVDLLELQDIEHALIGTADAGLGNEQRKRFTIGWNSSASQPSFPLTSRPRASMA